MGEIMTQHETDEKYMREALRQARRAAALGETPIGCVIVRTRHVGPEDFRDGKRTTPESDMVEKIIGRGYNRRNTDRTALAHAEIKAIAKASKEVGDWRLEGCTLYVTLEPCQMCAGAIVQSRVDRVVIGAMNPKAGCAGSIMNILQEPKFNHQVEITGGILGAECSEMLRRFFAVLRERRQGEKRRNEQDGRQSE